MNLMHLAGRDLSCSRCGRTIRFQTMYGVIRDKRGRRYIICRDCYGSITRNHETDQEGA